MVLKRAFVKLLWNDVRSFASVYLNENVSGINEMIWQKLGGIGDLGLAIFPTRSSRNEQSSNINFFPGLASWCANGKTSEHFHQC